MPESTQDFSTQDEQISRTTQVCTEIQILFSLFGDQVRLVRCMVVSRYADIFFAMAGEMVADVAQRVSFVDISGDGSGSGASRALQQFDVAEAHCWSKVEEVKLRRIIEAEGAEKFNAAIREVASILLNNQGSSLVGGRGVLKKRFTRRFSQGDNLIASSDMSP